ncbi:hypothetical protein OTU49_017448, partial [Cherax quadricarinatus]
SVALTNPTRNICNMLHIGKLCLLGLLTQVRTSSSLQEVRNADVASPRIAIIGGGIGGTSTAYFLKELFGDNAIIDVYESEKIGGRLATIPIAGDDYEVGGTAIHPKNQYMMDFVSKFGLQKRKSCAGSMGLFNGKEYLFRDSSWEIITLAKLILRYGWDVYRLHELTEEMLTKFNRIYTLQSEGHAYHDVASLLYAMDPKFLEMTKKSSAAWLKELGFSDLIINELVTAIAQCYYGQTPNIHAFVGSVSVAVADQNLWSVFGGNKRVAEELLKHSRASYLKRLVTSVALHSQGHFTVTSTETDTPVKRLFSEGSPTEIPEMNSSYDPRTQDYDVVVIATPLNKDKSNIKLVNFTKDFDFPGHFERIICTMVQGEVNPESLLLMPDDHIDEILVTNPGLTFNSFGKQCPASLSVNSQDYPYVWKIFSSAPLGEDQLKIFFKERNSTDVIDWLAYPHYNSDQHLGNFELVPGFYYLNAIEWAGSAIEMSIIGGKNVALLAYKYWLQDPNAAMNSLLKDEL